MRVESRPGIDPAVDLLLSDLAHLPGRTPRPPESLFGPLKAGLSGTMPPADLLSCPAFVQGLLLIERRFYWEAHEVLEAVWMHLPPACPERLFLRGLIQLANSGLKARMGWRQAAGRIEALADAALDEALRRLAGATPGMTTERLRQLRDQVASESSLNDDL